MCVCVRECVFFPMPHFCADLFVAFQSIIYIYIMQKSYTKRVFCVISVHLRARALSRYFALTNLKPPSSSSFEKRSRKICFLLRRGLCELEKS